MGHFMESPVARAYFRAFCVKRPYRKSYQIKQAFKERMCAKTGAFWWFIGSQDVPFRPAAGLFRGTP